MADCPLCDWRYEEHAPCVWAVQVREVHPVIWDGEGLRTALGHEAPDGRKEATGWHMCTAHPFEPEVLILGPIREKAPLAALNAALTALTRPRSLLLGASRAERQRVGELWADNV